MRRTFGSTLEPAPAEASTVTALAQLPMYDFPEVREATDALWRALAAKLDAAGIRDVPGTLGRSLTHHQSWQHDRLLLGQSCGYPAMTAFRDHLRIVATPVYRAPGCEGATHCSFFLVPRGAPVGELAGLRGCRLAINARDSNTGMNLPRLAIAPLAGGVRFFGEVIETGSHADSLAALAAGEVDAATIDCVTYAMLACYRPALVATSRVLARTAASPALPFVTTRTADEATVATLREVLRETLADPALAVTCAALLLAGVVPADEADYAVVLDYETEARRLGYAELA